MSGFNRVKRWVRGRPSGPLRAASNGKHHASPRSGARAETPPGTPADVPPDAPPDGLPPGITLEALGRLERQALFVVGCSRSGTTALTRALNRSPELLLLEEPNFFTNHGVREFAAFFNRMHRDWGTPRMKGTYVRPPVAPEVGPLPLLVRLAHEYRYVGGKVAFGPVDCGYNWSEAFFEYHAKYHFHARHLLIMRQPAESIWSMHKLFPDRSLPLLFETWLLSAAACIDAYRVFPNVRWIFFEDLSVQTVAKFAAAIPLEFAAPDSMLDRAYVRSQLADGELPPPLAPYVAWCAECLEIYRALRDNFCRERMVYCGPRAHWDFFDFLLRRISACVAEARAARAAVGGA